MSHVPVLYAPALEYLAIRPGGTYVDATFGAGGHTRGILERLTDGRVVALDADPSAAERARAITSPSFAFVQANFRDLDRVLDELGVADFAGAASDQSWDVPIEKSMVRAMEMAGEDVGVPIVAIEAAGTAQGFFGPILCRIPDEEEAVELYEHFAGLAKLGCFFELKRKKASGPTFR